MNTSPTPKNVAPTATLSRRQFVKNSSLAVGSVVVIEFADSFRHSSFNPMKLTNKIPGASVILLFGVLALVCAGCATTSATARKNGPAAYKVVFENEKVRVIEYHTGGEKDICGFGMHTHPAHLYLMLTDARLRPVTPDGKEVFEKAKAGDVGWEPAEQHISENLTGTDAACYLIEIKDKDWKPSTGLNK